MFRLTSEEFTNLRTQFASSNVLRSQIAISKPGRGGRRYLPYAFTEQGVAMLSGVLRSERAVLVNLEIMRAFVRLRQILAGNADLAHRLDDLEQRYDKQIKVVFDAIRQLMLPSPKPQPTIGFRPSKKP